MTTTQSTHDDIALSRHDDITMSPHTLPTRSANEGLVVSPADAGALAPDGARTPRGVGADARPRDRTASCEAFCAAYPRKEGYAPAEKEFNAQLDGGVSVETIIDGARRYAAAKVNIDSRWLKMPATWLREKCWREDPRPPRRNEP